MSTYIKHFDRWKCDKKLHIDEKLKEIFCEERLVVAGIITEEQRHCGTVYRVTAF